MVSTFAAAATTPGQGNINTLPVVTKAAKWKSAEDDARLVRYRRFLDFDNGRHDVGRLPPGTVALVANYARVFVRKGASYLMPAPVTLAVDPPEDTAAARAAAARCEKVLARVALVNGLAAADLATAVDCGVLGDGAFKVTWDRLAKVPRIVPVDPQTLFVESAPDDVRRPLVVRQAVEMKTSAVATFYGVTLDITADHVTVLEEWTDTRYCVYVNDQPVLDTLNPYGWIPYIIFPNAPRPHDFWGVSDIVDIMEIERQIDRRLSVLAALLDISGAPVTVLENVTGQQGVQVAPGAVWEIPENAKAYILNLLEGGIIEQHIKYIEVLYRVMDDLAEMPRMSFGEAGQARSGVALAVQLQPVQQKTSRKRLVWDAVLQQRSTMVLSLLHAFGGLDLGPFGAQDFVIRPQWAPVLPSDRQAIVADTISLYESGLYALDRAMAEVGVEDVAAEIAAIKAAGGPPAVSSLATGVNTQVSATEA